MPAYDSDAFRPPAPVVLARVRGPTGSMVSEIPFLIDTGADVSIVPLGAATAVGAAIEPSTVMIQSYAGEEAVLQLADLTVEFTGCRFRGSFLVGESTYGIAGRNVLDLIVLTLDGPQLSWSVTV